MLQTPVNGQSIGLMFDLDAILDTRHGTIKKIHPELYDGLRNSAKYYLRRSDNWKLVDSNLDTFKMNLHYASRDVETVKLSQITMVVRIAIDVIRGIITKIKGYDPLTSSFFIVLNVYPYKLSVELITEIAKKFLIQLGYPNAPIGFVNMPFGEITPDFLKKEKINHWFCYHYNDWLRDNFEPLNGPEPSTTELIVGCPNVKMYAPMIIQEENELDTFVSQLDENLNADVFMITHSVLKNIIDFEFLPTSTFCTIDVEKLKLLERAEFMEKSEILSTPQKVAKDIAKRLGDNGVVSSSKVNSILDEMQGMIYTLKQLNRKATMDSFKTTLVALNLELLKLYNATPFDSGIELEDYIDQLSLTVDTTEKDYLDTEKYWNGLGVKTIKRVVTLDSGEEIYRCVCAETIKLDFTTINKGDLLHQHPKREIKLKPVDFFAIEEFFK